MPPIYFGFETQARGASKLAVRTPDGDLEPAEPSQLAIYTHPRYSPMTSILRHRLGLAVAVHSYKPGSYIHLAADGLFTQGCGESTLPITPPGFAIVLKKGAALKQTDAANLELRGFSSMEFSGRTCWLHETGRRDDYLFARDIPEVDAAGRCPNRYLNGQAFESFLLVRSITTRICNFLSASTKSYNQLLDEDDFGVSSLSNAGWVNVGLSEEEATPTDMSSKLEFKNQKSFAPTDGSWEADLRKIMYVSGAAGGVGIASSAVVANIGDLPLGLLQLGHGEDIVSPGFLFKFNRQLASPDPNLIGDVLGRHFMLCLGDNPREQAETLSDLKRGLSQLRMTLVGDELTHLYKCISIAVEGGAGCKPIFDGTRYEGAYVGGGGGMVLTYRGRNIEESPVADLKNQFLMFSEHITNLRAISTLFKRVEEKEAVARCKSIFELRQQCLTALLSQADKDEITRRSSHLDFGRVPWAINPSNLAKCFSLIAAPSTLSDTHPIGRLSLFTTDPVVVALSCFDEKSAPSWDIPNGTPCSVVKATPPAPPPVPTKRVASKGEISDAAWVMVVRQTDLMSAVEEFRNMAMTLVYRTTSSALAKKVGHRVFSRERMGEFWKEMREALRAVNPNAVYEEEGESSKRKDAEVPEVAVGGTKKRRMGY